MKGSTQSITNHNCQVNVLSKISTKLRKRNQKQMTEVPTESTIIVTENSISELSRNDEHSLLSGQWISDNTIQAAQILISATYQHIAGFQTQS